MGAERLTSPPPEPTKEKKDLGNLTSAILPIRARLAAGANPIEDFTAEPSIPAFGRPILPEMKALSSYQDDAAHGRYACYS